MVKAESEEYVSREEKERRWAGDKMRQAFLSHVSLSALLCALFSKVLLLTAILLVHMFFRSSATFRIDPDWIPSPTLSPLKRI